MSDKELVVPVTFESLKYFIDSQLKLVEKAIPLNDNTKQKLCDRYGVSKAELSKVIRSLTAHLNKKCKGTFFTRQSKVEIVKQIIKLESRLNLKKRERLLEVNEMLLVFNHDMLPDLGGNLNNKKVEVIVLDDDDGTSENGDDDDDDDDGFDMNNINVNGGLTSIKKEEILNLVGELPDSASINTENLELLNEYDEARRKLKADMMNLKEAREKLKEYRKVKQSIDCLTDIQGIQENLALSSSKNMTEEVAEMQILADKLAQKLQSPESSMIKETIMRNLKYI
ncbi:hypothetical protein FOA43_002576 [Brettanomyces nanus]|uniref:Uncharacterized protein n=1 Tax=Eeniella nana TaxID=13502 RepID=A0A875S1H7_EENNA|nr:uncharacterized protein FOA43_002576 [Brettanomyces nanus]QPG75226.1 hypothetical protein FOA43_002576 [Brettanomyces nanus]